ncbi:hypothetical protein [Mangrovibacillus cuniculi]|uniref:Uncharacterized protein n=1 Tax=Mangrovibacillus cuniculi TaxID=2593652 RepID=A0A7S8CAL3_9BACI|nr:hypothetical protein [Mangrovibacillus cuniculi]QPC46450.1 hypothetical protein G8O30_05465 [Mangrovibacillus cuniculi]
MTLKSFVSRVESSYNLEEMVREIDVLLRILQEEGPHSPSFSGHLVRIQLLHSRILALKDERTLH